MAKKIFSHKIIEENFPDEKEMPVNVEESQSHRTPNQLNG